MRQVTLLFTGISVAGDGRSHPVCEHDDPLASGQSSLHFAVGPDTREGRHYISPSHTYLD
jgi:hypothetical protein